jgi:hypothetical protein
MHRKLLSSTGSLPLGNAPQKRLLKVASGPYAGRLAALVQSSSTDIKLTFADAPYTSWSTPLTVATDARDADFDATIDGAGNIQIVYGENGTDYLVTRRLTFASGNWGVGSKVTIYSGAASFSPSMAIESSGKIWVTWSRYSAPNKFIQVKSSTDNGAAWGTGAADAGQQITSGNSFEWSRLVITPDHIHVIAVYGNSRIVIRSLPTGGGSWSDEVTVASGGSGFTEHFDAAVRSDGLVGVVYNDSMFRYREFDGVNWGAIVTLNASTVDSPQLFFRGQTPVVVFLQTFDGYQKVMKVTDRGSGSFSTPVPLEQRAKEFDAVVLYEINSGTYQTVTAAASNNTAADLFHSASGCLLKNSGDQIYFGMADRFRYAELSLSTTGQGGALSFAYWDGANWRGFTPASGAAGFDTTNSRMVLWEDFNSIPSDWQKKIVANQNQFWVRVQVLSTFSRGPIGSHATAISALQRVEFRR